MQGAEIEDEGSVLKYMTKSEIEEQHSSLLIMTQRLAFYYFYYPIICGNHTNLHHLRKVLKDNLRK